MEQGSPPQAPDPNLVAGTQYQYNRTAALDTAALNRPNQITPYGSLTWEQGAPTRTFNQQKYDDALKAQYGGDPMAMQSATASGAGLDRNDERFYDMQPSTQYTSKVSLDPRVQAVLDAQLQTSQGLSQSVNNALGRVNDTMAQPLDVEGGRKAVEDALYSRYTRTLDPQMAQQKEALRSDLINRGFMEGTPAYERELARFGRDSTDAYQQARTAAVAGGGDEQARQLALRNQVINELASLRSGQQVQSPQFSSGASGAVVQPGNYAGASQQQYQGQLAGYNADVAGNNALMGGLFSLGSAAVGAPPGTFQFLGGGKTGVPSYMQG